MTGYFEFAMILTTFTIKIISFYLIYLLRYEIKLFRKNCFLEFSNQ